MILCKSAFASFFCPSSAAIAGHFAAFAGGLWLLGLPAYRLRPRPWTPTTRVINLGVVRGSFTKLGPTPCSSPCKGSYYKKKCNAERIMYQVWSLTQFYSVDFSKSRIDVKKVRFQQTHNQGLRQLLLTVSWDLRA